MLSRRVLATLFASGWATAQLAAQTPHIQWMRGGIYSAQLGAPPSYSPDGQYIVAMDFQNVKIFSAATGLLLHTVIPFTGTLGQSAEISSIAVCPSLTLPSQMFAVSGSSGTGRMAIKFYSLPQGRLLSSISTSNVATGLSFSPDCSSIADTGNNQTGLGGVYNVSTGVFTEATYLMGGSPVSLIAPRYVAGGIAGSASSQVFLGPTTFPWTAWTSYGSALGVPMSVGQGYFVGGGFVYSLSLGCPVPSTGVSCTPASYVFRTPSSETPGGSAVFSPDGMTLASVTGQETPDANCSIQTFQTPTGTGTWATLASSEVLGTFQGCFPTMGFSPDSKSLAVANSQIQILNNDSELSLQSTVAYDWGDMAVAYSPDGSFVVSGGKDGSVVVWNASNGSPQMVLQGVSVPDSSVSSVAVSPEPVSPYGYLIAVSSGSTAGSCCKVSVYSSATGALIQSIPVSGSATFLSPESILVTQGGLSIYSAVTGALTRSINPCLGLGTSAVFPDGHAAAVSCPSNILIVGLANGAVQKTLAESSLISSMAVSPNSLQVAVGLPGSLQIYSVTTGDLERTVTLPVGSQREPPAIAFSRDGRTIADGGGEGLALYFVNVNSGDIVRTWKTETGGVPANEGWDNLTAITYSLDNQFVYYGRGDGTSVMITNPISAPPLALLQSVRGGAVIGGDVLMSRVVVSPAVPAGESVVVHLESSNSSVASVPASVTVPAGAESATFPITTTSVASRQTVSITAYEGKDFQTAEVTVNP